MRLLTSSTVGPCRSCYIVERLALRSRQHNRRQHHTRGLLNDRANRIRRLKQAQQAIVNHLGHVEQLAWLSVGYGLL